MSSALLYGAYATINVLVLKTLNSIVTTPYMDEPFHVPQVQAYCRGEWRIWDPKITTPPGLYLTSVLFNKIFLFKCTLHMLRLTPLLFYLALPLVTTQLLCINQRTRPPSNPSTPTVEALVISAFPIAWFFAFLYYTEIPSLVLVLGTVVAAAKGHHMLASLLGTLSCGFRQTNIVWVLYAFAASRLSFFRFRRGLPGEPSPPKLHDPPALESSPRDLIRTFFSLPRVVGTLLSPFPPYLAVVLGFVVFVVWNGGIVLGDKSNHVPALHIPQFYYFLAFSTIMGWPVLVSEPGGPLALMRGVCSRMFGSRLRTLLTVASVLIMWITIYLFTIHHPFLLADNRHYTFYVWRRVFMVHPAMPYILAPGYVACAWAWFLRSGHDRSLLQVLLLPLAVLPTLLPTPLLEPRYFLIPYILLRTQVVDVPLWSIALEGIWYSLINWATMDVFLFRERPGVGRFMW